MVDSLKEHADKVYIIRIDGTRFGPFETTLEPTKALIYTVTLNAGAGDKLERHGVDGAVETYSITGTHFQPKMSQIQAHYTIRLRRD